MNADEKLIEGFSVECDALKASNAELREQLAANAKLISELQHCLRLSHRTGTYAQQVRECAIKAKDALDINTILRVGVHRDRVVELIEGAFGLPPKDECAEACETEWRRMELTGEAHRSVFNEFRKGFHAAWKLAKGKP